MAFEILRNKQQLRVTADISKQRRGLVWSPLHSLCSLHLGLLLADRPHQPREKGDET